MSYVVRIDRPDAEPDFKVFSSLNDARKRFSAATFHVNDGDLVGAFLFSVEGENDPRLSVEAVKRGDAILMGRDQKARIDKELNEIAEEVLATILNGQSSNH